MSKPLDTTPITRKKFGSRWYRRIQPSEIQPSDIIEFRDKNTMMRTRRVASVAKRRQSLKTDPVKYGKLIASKGFRLRIEEIDAAWTKRKEV
jgi:hypothetical protein